MYPMAIIERRHAAVLLRLSLVAGLLQGCGGTSEGPGPVDGTGLVVQPPSATVPALATKTFTVSAPVSVRSVAWTVQEGSTGGSITSSGLYTAPAAAGSFHVVVASATDPTVRATATVLVTGSSLPVTVTVTPSVSSVPASGVQQFTATVANASNGTVNWSLKEGASCGTISASGLLQAPAWSAVCTVVATSVADPTRSGSAAVTVAGGTGTAVQAGAIRTQTWTSAGSPYRVFGDVYIPSGNRLTIRPGVQVRFQGHYRMEGPGIIDARGTSPAQRDILFTAEDPVAGWYGIRIWNGTGAIGTAPDVGDYHLENCIIENVVKDRSRLRSFGDAVYNDSRGALYVYGATAWTAGAPEDYAGLKYSDLHLNGLMLRNNRAVSTDSPESKGGAIYFNTLSGSIQPIWTDMVFDRNMAVVAGGAFMMHHSGPVTFKNSVMTGNVVTVPEQAGAGGAIGYWDVSGPVTLDNVVYTRNDPPGFATAEAPSVIVLNPPP